MIAIICEAIVAVSIIALFSICWAAVVHPMAVNAVRSLMEAFRKPVRQEAIIIPFARPGRRGGRNG